MLNSSVLDVAIGLVFIYLVLGLMCTTANEWIAQCLDLRAKTLKEGIGRLLHEAPADDASFQPGDIHPMKMLGRLMTPGDKLAGALGVDPSTRPGAVAPESADLPAIREILAKLLNDTLKDPLLSEKIDVRGVSAATLKVARKRLAGRQLEQANAAMLREAYPQELGSLAVAYYRHPLMQSLCQAGKLPSYIPKSVFSATVIQILGGAEGVDGVRLAIARLPESPVKDTLTMLAPQPGAQMAEFDRDLQLWFEHSMDRVSGWYKKKTQLVTILVAAGITVWANADTVSIAQKLYVTPVISQRLAHDMPAKSQGEVTAAQKTDLGELTGWSTEFVAFHRLQSGNPSAPPDDSFPGLGLVASPSLLWAWLWAVLPTHLLGWILTGVAVSLGAPFWFDILNKFMNIRASGTAPNEKGQDKSKA